MNKEQLEIAKRIAESEGIETINYSRFIYEEDKEGLLFINGKSYKCYNPFTWNILGPLMVKYDVVPDYNCGYVSIGNVNEYFNVRFKNKSEIPMAILKCIVASQGKLK